MIFTATSINDSRWFSKNENRHWGYPQAWSGDGEKEGKHVVFVLYVLTSEVLKSSPSN